MGDEKEVQEKRKLSLEDKILLYIAIAGFILTVVGVIGTYYQILESKIIWIALLVLGFAILLALLFFYKKESDGLRKKTEEQEVDINSLKGKTEEQKASIKHLEELIGRSGFIPKVNVDQGNTLQIISGGGKLFLVEEHIR